MAARPKILSFFCLIFSLYSTSTALAQQAPSPAAQGANTAQTAIPSTQQAAVQPSAACSIGANGAGKTPALNPLEPDSSAVVKGNVTGATSGTVQICKNGQAASQATINLDGSFVSSIPISLAFGDKVSAQTAVPAASGGPATYGPLSPTIPVGKCSESGTGPRPLVDPISTADLVTGSLAKGSTGTVRICVEDQEVDRVQANASGEFAAKLVTSLTANQKVAAQSVMANAATQAETYGTASDAITYTAANATTKPGTANEECNTSTAPYLLTPLVQGIKHVVGCSQSGTAYTVVSVYSDKQVAPSAPTTTSTSPSSKTDTPPPPGPTPPAPTPSAPPAGNGLRKCPSDDSKSITRSTEGVPDSNGQFQVDFVFKKKKGHKPYLSEGNWVCVQEYNNQGKAMNTNPVPLLVKLYGDEESQSAWGRVRLYVSGGVVLAQTNGQFSSEDLFIGLHTDTNFIRKQTWLVNTFFDAQLTSAPVATCSSSSSTSSSAGTSGCSSSGTNPPTSFISSQKAGVVQAGLYVPYAPNSWRWSYGGRSNALFVAPLIKVGVETLTNNTQVTASTSPSTGPSTTTTLNNANVYKFYAGGFRIGHFGMPASWNKSPYLFSYIDFAWGKWDSFEQCTNSTCISGTYTANSNTYSYVTNPVIPLMLNIEGKLVIPKTPVFLGVDSYIPFPRSRELHGDLRFFFGVRLDVACLFNAFKGGTTPSMLSCTEGSSTTTTTSATAATPSSSGQGGTPSTGSAPDKTKP